MNIEPVAEPDPWPRRGLAAAYKRFILKRIKPFLENNRHLNRNEVITDAIRLTWECSQKFKPELGFYFSTYLRHWLPNRLYDLYGIEKSRKDEEEPDILKTEPLQFLSGGNGARLVFDTGVLTIGVRVTGNDLDYLTGTLDRIRENSAAVPATTRTRPLSFGPSWITASSARARPWRRRSRAVSVSSFQSPAICRLMSACSRKTG